MSERFRRWFKEERDLPELREKLQLVMGEDRVFVESAVIELVGENPRVVVQFRFPIDAELEPLEEELAAHANKWMSEGVENSMSDPG
jgi:hypothetical protein